MGRPVATGKTGRLVQAAFIFALALVLTIAENALPSLPVPVPGVKFGLSNIAVMYALVFLSKGQAYSIAVLKAMFVLVTRGLIAGMLSLSGGILSLTVMLVLMTVFGEKVSYTILSISGAIAHNIGQFVVITVIYTGMYMWAYLPVLIISGVVAGIITATLLRVIIPVLRRLS
ncbi:MAG: Gx transporter family protein [Clostridiaceae bacterium]|nr:Gx transporter family protein [Clostridiaceae bacterium]